MPFALVWLPPARWNPGLLGAAGALTLVIAALAAAARRERLPGWGPCILAFAYLFVVALLRAAGGASGVATMALLPVFWVGLCGTRRQLWCLLIGVVLIFVIPLILVGGAAYPSSAWRAGILFIALSGIVGTTTHSLVARVRESEANLRNVAALARGLPSHANPRQAICEAACSIAGADIVQFWEPDGATHLQVTAAIGVELSADLRVALIGETSGAAIAYHTCRKCIVLNPYAPGAPVSVRMCERLGAASVLYEPVVGPWGALGVLVVIWKTAISQIQDRAVDAVGLLATEAAAAIARADMTAQLHAVARKDELRLRQLLEAAPDAMIISDAGGIIQTVNDQTQRLLGYTDDELVGEPIDRLVPDSQRMGHAAHRATFIADSSTRAMGVERELHARHKDGHQIPVSITLSPVQTDDGLCIIAAVRDITERRLAEEQLRAAEEQFRHSFDFAPIGMTILDLDGRFLQVNDAFCAILGHPRTTLVGLCSQAITHPDDLAQD
ncbi:MAG: PAS domain-containing protein, partial [Solirubrobacteraceae bacterium]